jgi:hypothetical protein
MYHLLRTGIFREWSMMEARTTISEWDAMHPEDDVTAELDSIDYSDED